MRHVFAICMVLALAFGMGQVHRAGAAEARVRVKLTVVEVSLTKLQRLGCDTAKLVGKPAAKSEVDSADNKALRLSIPDDGIAAQRIIDALQKDSLLRLVEQKTFVVASGEANAFCVGDKGHVGDEKQGGDERQGSNSPPDHASCEAVASCTDRLELTPEVMGDKVRLSFQHQHAEPDLEQCSMQSDPSPGVVAGPKSTVSLDVKDGETAVLVLPIRRCLEAYCVGLPYISEIPFVGAVFRRTVSETNELATFIVVRPEIVETPTATVARVPAGSQE